MSTPAPRSTSSWARSRCRWSRIPASAGAGSRSISDVHEGPDGLSAASVVLADGMRVVLGPEPITIGRLPESTIVINDPNASRRHAEIRRSGNDVVVVDLRLDERHPGQWGNHPRAGPRTTATRS